MKIILFVEGDTEKDVLPNLLKRCLEEQIKRSIGIREFQRLVQPVA